VVRFGGVTVVLSLATARGLDVTRRGRAAGALESRSASSRSGVAVGVAAARSVPAAAGRLRGSDLRVAVFFGAGLAFAFGCAGAGASAA
jgi:hypothetical protein